MFCTDIYKKSILRLKSKNGHIQNKDISVLWFLLNKKAVSYTDSPNICIQRGLPLTREIDPTEIILTYASS